MLSDSQNKGKFKLKYADTPFFTYQTGQHPQAGQHVLVRLGSRRALKQLVYAPNSPTPFQTNLAVPVKTPKDKYMYPALQPFHSRRFILQICLQRCNFIYVEGYSWQHSLQTEN